MKRDPALVHKMMSRIRGKNTGIELQLRAALTERGIHYRLYSSEVYGHPDIVLQRWKIAIFCDSEFWHGYRFEENEQQRSRLSEFWIKKIRRNMARDAEVNAALKEQGYTVLRFWGKQITKDIDGVMAEILEAIETRRTIELMRESITARTTLAYIEQDGKYLLLHRTKEDDDINQGKWIGVGGHLEPGESYVAAMKREIFEETGLTVTEYRYYGALDFLNDKAEPERMFLFKVTGFTGTLKECNEGDLAWIDKKEMLDLPMWEGDKAFLPLLDQEHKAPFRMNLLYYGDRLLAVEGPFYARPQKKKKKKKR